MRQKAFTTFHCMKYIQPLVINTIIHNLDGVAAGIKAYKQILVFIVFQKTILNRMHKRPFNVGFGKTMLKSRLIIDNTHFHTYTSILARKEGKNNLGKPDVAGFMKAARIGA